MAKSQFYYLEKGVLELHWAATEKLEFTELSQVPADNDDCASPPSVNEG